MARACSSNDERKRNAARIADTLTAVWQHNSNREIRPRFRRGKASVALASAQLEDPRDPFSPGEEPITNASRVLASSTQISPSEPRARTGSSTRLVAREL